MDELIKTIKDSTSIKVGAYLILSAVISVSAFTIYKQFLEVKLTRLRIEEMEEAKNK